jgi:hypothetical protein
VEKWFIPNAELLGSRRFSIHLYGKYAWNLARQFFGVCNVVSFALFCGVSFCVYDDYLAFVPLFLKLFFVDADYVFAVCP